MGGVLSEFIEAAKELMRAGPRINAESRRRIRDVVGALGDDLETALDVTIAYLRSGSRLSKPGELADHLSDAPAKLRDFYRDFRVCRGLSGMRNDLEQAFGPRRSGPSASRLQRIPGLARALAKGQRSVLDDVKDLMGSVSHTAVALRGARGSRLRMEVANARRLLSAAVSDLERQRRSVQVSARRILDGL